MAKTNAKKQKREKKAGQMANNREEMNIISKYLEEINQIDLLTREREIELAKLIENGDEKARDELVMANLRFVVTVARHYKNNTIPLNDLINEGNMGLLMATKHYDYRKGYHFISYAVWWIRWAIKQALADQASLIRLPINKASKLFKINQILESDLPEPEKEIMGKLHLQGHELSSVLSAAKAYKSFESPIENDKQDMQLSDIIVDEQGERPMDAIIEDGLHDNIQEALESLSEQERTIIKCRFGLDGHSEMTLREIAKRMNMTKEGIRQIQKRAIERLRQPYRANKLRDYIYSN